MNAWHAIYKTFRLDGEPSKVPIEIYLFSVLFLDNLLIAFKVALVVLQRKQAKQRIDTFGSLWFHFCQSVSSLAPVMWFRRSSPVPPSSPAFQELCLCRPVVYQLNDARSWTSKKKQTLRIIQCSEGISEFWRRNKPYILENVWKAFHNCNIIP